MASSASPPKPDPSNSMTTRRKARLRPFAYAGADDPPRRRRVHFLAAKLNLVRPLEGPSCLEGPLRDPEERHIVVVLDGTWKLQEFEGPGAPVGSGRNPYAGPAMVERFQVVVMVEEAVAL